jgi:uncharacterized coiled-coil protein SlyX
MSSILDKIKALLAENKAATEVKAEKPAEDIQFSNEATPAVLEAPEEEAPKEENPKAEEKEMATPEERLDALEAEIAAIKAALEEIVKSMVPNEAQEAEMAELKKEKNALAKKVKELSDAPAVPQLNFARVEAASVKEVGKSDIIKGESIRDMVKRMTAK